MKSNDEAEAITIRNNSFFINANLMTAPQGVAIREFIQNALEAAIGRNEKRRLIRMYADSVGKFVLINSGTGISETDLIICTDFSESIGKTMGLKRRENRGEGAKLAGLPFNTLGIRYRSMKDGVFSETTVYYNEEIGWARKLETVEHEDGRETTQGSYPVGEENITEEEAERYKAFEGGDFTEVVLYGQKEEQRTAYDPYGNGREGDKQAIPNEIFARYWDWPKLDIPIKVEYHGESFRGGADFRPLIPVGQIIAAHSDLFDNFKERMVDLPNGVKLEFVKTKKSEKNRTPWNGKSGGRNGGRAALVWRGEMYDVLEDRAWARAAPSFGLPTLAPELSLFVHIPADWDITDGRYRDMLMHNGVRISLRDFEVDVVLNRPEWVKSLINIGRSESSTQRAVYDDLMRFAVRLSVKADPKGPQFTVIHGGLGEGEEGSSPSGGKVKDNSSSATETTASNGGSAPGSGNGSRSATKGTRKARAAAGAGEQTRASVPFPVWTDDPMKTNELLIGRGVDFRPSTVDLYLNRQWPSRTEMIDAIFNDYVRVNHPDVPLTETINFLITDRVENAIYRAVGRAILIALHKRGTKHWSSAAVENALSRESLTIVFDMVADDIGSIAKALQRTDDFKGAIAEAGGGDTAASA